MPMPRRIESHMIAGPAGRLEALLEAPENGPVLESAVVCHPHPRHGGTMHNKAVYRIARGLRRSGSVVLRFNFRGVNLSEGVYDHGVGELEDAAQCLRWLRRRFPDLPYTLAGFSFGARIALKLGARLKDPSRIIAAGYPTVCGDHSFLWSERIPRIFIQSTNDAYGPRHELEALLATIPGTPEAHWIKAKDHFFTGALEQLEETVRSLR